MNTKLWTIIGLTVAAIFLGALIYGSFSTTQATCELCVEFRGQRQCRRGAGADQEEAQTAAVRSACAVMAAGMDETIACTNTPPVDVTCSG